MHTAHVGSFQHFGVGDLVLPLDLQYAMQARMWKLLSFFWCLA
jgi:hypothetical protein